MTLTHERIAVLELDPDQRVREAVHVLWCSQIKQSVTC